MQPEFYSAIPKIIYDLAFLWAKQGIGHKNELENINNLFINTKLIYRSYQPAISHHKEKSAQLIEINNIRMRLIRKELCNVSLLVIAFSKPLIIPRWNLCAMCSFLVTSFHAPMNQISWQTFSTEMRKCLGMLWAFIWFCYVMSKTKSSASFLSLRVIEISPYWYSTIQWLNFNRTLPACACKCKLISITIKLSDKFHSWTRWWRRKMMLRVMKCFENDMRCVKDVLKKKIIAKSEIQLFGSKLFTENLIENKLRNFKSFALISKNFYLEKRTHKIYFYKLEVKWETTRSCVAENVLKLREMGKLKTKTFYIDVCVH